MDFTERYKPPLLRARIAPDSVRALRGIWAWSTEEGTLAYLSVFLVGVRLLISIRSRFWLDETATYWTTNGGFGELYSRCLASPLSIAYAAMFCAIRELGAHQEWIFRVPSLIAFVLSVWLLFRLSRRLFDTRVAWLTCVIFLQLAPIIYAATDARPYVFGLLFSVVSTNMLVRLVEAPSPRAAAGYGITAALVIHFHLLLGVLLVVHVFYVCYILLKGQRISVSYLAIAAVALAAVSLPIAFQGLWIFRHASVHVYLPHPTALDLVETLAPKRLALMVAIVLVLTLAMKRKLAWQRSNWNVSHRVLILLWMFVPPSLYFFVSNVSGIVVFQPRYFLCYSPGLALCFAAAIASVRPRIAGYLIFGLMVANSAYPLLFPAQLRHTYNRGDWGAALAFVQKETASDDAPVFLRSQYVLSDREDCGNTTLYDCLAVSPLTYYPARAHWIPLRLTLTPWQASYLERSFETDVGSARRFLFVSFTGPASYKPYLDYLRANGGASNTRQIADFDGIDVFEFVK